VEQERVADGVGSSTATPKADRVTSRSKTLVAELPASAWKTVTYRDRDGKPIAYGSRSSA
jgi:hypothetical protein